MATATQPAPQAQPATKPAPYMAQAYYNANNVHSYVTGATVLTITAKGSRYAPRPSLQGNAASWPIVTGHAQANKGGTFTLASLQQALTARNHANYAKYCIRQGWLGVVAVNNPAYTGPYSGTATK